MASKPIVLSDPRMLAEFIRQSEFKAFFEKRFAVPPEYAALLFKNGELIDAYKGGHFSVGGIFNQLKGIVGGSTHVSMMIADLKPFPIQSVLKAISKDKVEIAGVVTLEMQVNPDKPSNFLGMMQGISRSSNLDKKGVGRRALSKDDVLERIRPHLTDRVFEAVISRVEANDIRGNTGLQDKLQADIMEEVERIAGDLGLMVRSVSIEWALNKEEISEQERADLERQQDAMDHQFDLAKRQAERMSDATEFQLKANLEQAKLENATEDELKHMALKSEIQFIDAREDAKRRQELSELEHQIEFLQKERKGTFENAIANAQHKTELLEIEQKQTKLDTQIAALREAHAQEMRKSGAFNELEITAQTQKQQRHHISELQEIELRGEKVRSELKRVELKDERAHEISILNANKNLSPEQILAINAGLSPDVAAVLVEQARGKTAANEDVMASMREMVEAATAAQIRSEEQARTMFQMGMQGAVGVAQGAGGGQAPANVGEASVTNGNAQSIECPKCRTTNAATTNFCKQCGHKLRT